MAYFLQRLEAAKGTSGINVQQERERPSCFPYGFVADIECGECGVEASERGQ
jgi:hypothetical protein